MVLRLALLVLALSTVGGLAERPAKPLRTKDGPVLPRREMLQVLGASQRMLLADFYWLQTIHQTGSANTATEYRDIYFYADMATDLDPRFRYVYEWGGVAVPFSLGREQWVNTDLSSRLLEKGLAQFPDDVRFKFQLAYNKMTFERDLKGAADLFMELAQVPNTPAFLPQLATRLYAQAGNFESGLAVAITLRDGAVDEETRAFYDRRIQEIHRERLLTELDRVIAAFGEEKGRLPANVRELVSAGYLTSVPEDPLGGKIFIDRHGRARSTAGVYRLEMYDDVKKRQLAEDLAAGTVSLEDIGEEDE